MDTSTFSTKTHSIRVCDVFWTLWYPQDFLHDSSRIGCAWIPVLSRWKLTQSWVCDVFWTLWDSQDFLHEFVPVLSRRKLTQSEFVTCFELSDIHKISYMILRGSVAHEYQYFLDENSLNLSLWRVLNSLRSTRFLTWFFADLLRMDTSTFSTKTHSIWVCDVFWTLGDPHDFSHSRICSSTFSTKTHSIWVWRVLNSLRSTRFLTWFFADLLRMDTSTFSMKTHSIWVCDVFWTLGDPQDFLHDYSRICSSAFSTKTHSIWVCDVFWTLWDLQDFLHDSSRTCCAWIPLLYQRELTRSESVTCFELSEIRKISYMILRGSVAHGYQYFLNENSLDLSLWCVLNSRRSTRFRTFADLFQYFLYENSLNLSLTCFELSEIHKISYMILRGSVAHGYQYFLDENSLNLSLWRVLNSLRSTRFLTWFFADLLRMDTSTFSTKTHSIWVCDVFWTLGGPQNFLHDSSRICCTWIPALSWRKHTHSESMMYFELWDLWTGCPQKSLKSPEIPKKSPWNPYVHISRRHKNLRIICYTLSRGFDEDFCNLSNSI